MNSEQRHTILLIDDEPEILSSLNRLLRRDYQVLLANSAAVGLELMSQHEVHVILSDQRMPEMEGVEFLTVVKGKYPYAIRMLLTGYADLENVIAAINSGSIYRYLVKPWNPDELVATIREACQKYDLIIQNNQLTQNLMAANVELEERVKERTAELERANNYLSVLSQVGALLQADLNYQQVISTLESEMKKHQLDCLVINCDDTDFLDKDSLRNGSLANVRKSGIESDCALLLADIPEIEAMIQSQQAIFLPNMQPFSTKMLDRFRSEIPEPYHRLKGVLPEGKGVVLPLRIRQQITRILVLWGTDLVENDVIALSVFANQVAIALENAVLFEAVHRLAEMDGLTGVFNRRRIIEMAEREFARAKRTGRHFSVIMIDVDRFKQVNDSYGHNIGDQVLRAITNRCQEVLRKDLDLIGRYGGDEFVVLLPEADAIIGQKIADRLHKYIQQTPISTSSGPIPVSISLGVSSLTDSISNLDDLLNLADQTMYQVKRLGREN